MMITEPAPKPLFSKPKLIFIVLLLLAGFGFYVYAMSHPVKKSTGSILGEETTSPPISKQIDFNGIKDTANTYIDNAVKTSQTVVQSAVKEGSGIVAGAATQVAEKVKDSIVDSAVGSAVKQIEKLPQEEQRKIREYICK